MSVLSLNGKGINETNELDCLRELVIQGGDEVGQPLTDAQLRATPVPVLVSGAASGIVTVIATSGQSAGTASLAARATRTGVLIRNLSTSPETCWFGYSSGVTATTGMQLSVGESAPVQNAAQIFFFSVSGTAIINCAEDYN